MSRVSRRQPPSGRLVATGLLAVSLFAGVPAEAVAGEEARVFRVVLKDQAITPVTAKYVGRALDEATAADAACLVIQLDTPGGLMRSAQRIVKRILRSEVPVVVYVAPEGSRAASAGLFVTLAAHVAAMAPQTHIGAATPVRMGGSPLPGSDDAPSEGDGSGDQKKAPSSAMKRKVVNDTKAWARALAEGRGRNAKVAELAVEEAKSITGEEAAKKNLVDLRSPDLRSLLETIDGREVELASKTTTLRTADAEIRTIRMWWGERVLRVLSNPNVAFLLMMFGFYGILFELYSPGWGVAGTLGAICLLLGLFGMAVLPVNYAGLGLIALALGLFVAEVFVTSFGALSLGGVVCLILGALMLVDTPTGFMDISMVVVLPVALATSTITFLLVAGIVRAYRGEVRTGAEAMVGGRATAGEPFAWEGDGYRGMVRVRGEWWRAVSPAPVRQGDALRVDRHEGLTLHVTPGGGDAGTATPQREGNG